jgi:hypothetical protein
LKNFPCDASRVTTLHRFIDINPLANTQKLEQSVLGSNSVINAEYKLLAWISENLKGDFDEKGNGLFAGFDLCYEHNGLRAGHDVAIAVRQVGSFRPSQDTEGHSQS